MGDEQTVTELLSFASDLALDDGERMRLALVIGNLMAESWAEGYSYGSYSATADVLFHAPERQSRIISH